MRRGSILPWSKKTTDHAGGLLPAKFGRDGLKLLDKCVPRCVAENCFGPVVDNFHFPDSDPVEFMRHYYDVHALLQRADVQEFIGTQAFIDHKKRRFRRDDNQNIAQNEAFLLSDPKTRAIYDKAYEASSSLYYKDKPTFEQIIAEIGKWISKL